MKLLSRDRTICGGLFAAQRVRNRRRSKPNTVVIRRAGYGALGRLDRVRGVRFLRLTCRAADGPAQPEMTLMRHRDKEKDGCLRATIAQDELYSIGRSSADSCHVDVVINSFG